ncbi:MAG: hypothetical protein JKY40_10580 [Gammaproteobacteria bacterium]|nr:hypothetical protein [Gammaproteobacteria bacterium]MBL4729731.1 hypothetical protein [Gammaproteobacteria bacterium]
MMIQFRHNQKGFGLIGASLSLGILAYVAFQLIPIASRLQFYTYRTATVVGINELAQASKTYFVDPINVSSWPADTDTLVAGNYLAGFANRNGYGFPYSFTITGDSIVITTETPNVEQANNVASHFGGLATVTGTNVAVVWSAPGNDANHEALIPRDGSRDIFGTITHRVGSGANLDLGSNNITSVNTFDSSGSVTARNGALTGLLSSDVGAIDVLTVNEIRITP